MGRLHRMLILKACPYQQILSSKGAETTNGTASQHIHINKYVDLPDGSTTQIVDSGPLFTFLVIPKQQNGTRVLYVRSGDIGVFILGVEKILPLASYHLLRCSLGSSSDAWSSSSGLHTAVAWHLPQDCHIIIIGSNGSHQ